MSLTHSFNIEIAKLHDVDTAIFLNNIAHWVRENQANNKNNHNNRTWTYNTEDAFTKIFPYWTRRQMQRIIANCVSKNLLVAGNYNKAKYDRTKWYALSDSMLCVFGLTKPTLQPMPSLIEPNGSLESTERVNGLNQTVQPIPNNKTQIENTDNIYNKKNKNDFENDSLSLYDAEPKELTETKKKNPKALDLAINNNPHDLPVDLVKDFLEVRKAKRAPLTKTAIKQLNNELTKCVTLGINPIKALEVAVSNGWTTVKADWISKNEVRKSGRPDVNSTGWSKRNPEDIF